MLVLIYDSCILSEARQSMSIAISLCGDKTTNIYHFRESSKKLMLTKGTIFLTKS